MPGMTAPHLLCAAVAAIALHTHMDAASASEPALPDDGLLPAIVHAGDPLPPGQAGTARLDGVALVRFDGAQSVCSGALLWTGLHVLTAGHCVPAVQPDARISFPRAGLTVRSAQATLHPGWSGRIDGGNDLAVLTLAQRVAVQGYRLYRGDRLPAPGTTVILAGYGDTGTGAAIRGSEGALHWGTNTYDLVYGRIPGAPYLFDFDDGDPARDMLGQRFQVPHLGTGPGEAFIARGDSGGPSFIDGLLAGIHSFLFSYGPPIDADGVVNSSFGEGGGDTRIAFYAPWIDSVATAPIPEPGTCALLAAGLIVVALRRRAVTAAG
jgi:hypothetical protein